MVTGLILLRSCADSHAAEFVSVLVLLYLEDMTSPWFSASGSYNLLSPLPQGFLNIEGKKWDIWGMWLSIPQTPNLCALTCCEFLC